MKSPIFKNVLVLSPHTDDGELGAGGTIARLVENGSHVTYYAFSAPKVRLKNECKKSLAVLGVSDFKIFDIQVRIFPKLRQEILDILYAFNQETEIDLVLTPSTNDLHQDHQTVTNEALRIFKDSTILGYELPWNLIVFRESCFIPLQDHHVEKKIQALWNYQSQIETNRQYFNKEYLESLMRSRGLKINRAYAEAFEAIKVVFKSF